MALSYIDYLHNVDFTKGFKRYHVKWSVGDISTLPKKSKSFTTTIGTSNLSWSLKIIKRAENYWFGLASQSNDKEIPVQFRVFLSAQGNVIINLDPLFCVLDDAIRNWGRDISIPNFDERIAGKSEIIFHCLIDIPTAVFPDLISRKRKLERDDEETVEKQRKYRLVDDISKLFTADNNFSDVTVVVKKGRKIMKSFSCHRYILSSRSSVFERMFASGEWIENTKKNKDGYSVEIKDIDENTMEIILNYVYTSRMPDESTDQESIFSIMYAADKYDLNDLKNWCVCTLILKHYYRSDRVVQLQKADLHQLVQLKAFCLAYFSMDFFAFFGNSALSKDLTENLMSEISAEASKRQCDTEEILVQN